jgi:hypothetical protein
MKHLFLGLKDKKSKDEDTNVNALCGIHSSKVEPINYYVNASNFLTVKKDKRCPICSKKTLEYKVKQLNKKHEEEFGKPIYTEHKCKKSDVTLDKIFSDIGKYIKNLF